MSIHPSEIYQGNLTITDMVTALVAENPNDYDVEAIVIGYLTELNNALPEGIAVYDGRVEVSIPGTWEDKSEEIADALGDVDLYDHIADHDRSVQKDEAEDKNDEDEDDDDDDDDDIEFSCPATATATGACPDWRDYCQKCTALESSGKIWAYQMVVCTVLGIAIGVLGATVGVLIVRALT